MFILLGTKNYIYYILLFISFVLPNIIYTYIEYFLSFTSPSFSKRVSVYSDTHLSYLSSFQGSSDSSTLLVLSYLGLTLFYYVILASGFQFFSGRSKCINNTDSRLYSFLILLLSFVNFLSVVPSGSRFKTLFLLFAFAYLLISNSRMEKKHLYYINYFGIIELIIYLVITLRFVSESLDLFIFFPLALLGSYYSIQIPANILFRWLH